MQYDEIRYIPERQDPSLILETEEVIAKVIDNSGLLVEENAGWTSYNTRYTQGQKTPHSHHLGYHGIRCLYNKEEKRNLVVPCASWLNLQGVNLEGIENDPVDERASYGVGRGWPIRMESRGSTVVLTIEPMPRTQFSYSLELRPVEPDCIEFDIRFSFSRELRDRFAGFTASWPCYMNAHDDVRFFYPGADYPNTGQWSNIGERPDVVLGDPVNYRHQQTCYDVADQAFPVGFGHLGKRALIMMFDDPGVEFFVVNAGGHSPLSSVQNPAWDFRWHISDFPANHSVGFTGRLIYTEFKGAESVFKRYQDWTGRGREQAHAEPTQESAPGADS